MTTLRVVTGTAKNKKLKTPNVEGFRAVQEVAKMSLFSILEDRVVDAQCLDLYAGSGNLGIEALSRGAAWCEFVDEHPNAIKVIQENLRECGLEDRGEVIRTDVVKYAANAHSKYDLIFVDPFYENTSHIFLMKNLEEILEDTGFIAFFHGEEMNMEKTIKDTELRIVDMRRFGKSYFHLLTKNTK